MSFPKLKRMITLSCVAGEHGESGFEGFLHRVAPPGGAVPSYVITGQEGQLLPSPPRLLPLHVGSWVPGLPQTAPRSKPPPASPRRSLTTNQAPTRLPHLRSTWGFQAPRSSCEKRDHKGGDEGGGPAQSAPGQLPEGFCQLRPGQHYKFWVRAVRRSRTGSDKGWRRLPIVPELPELRVPSGGAVPSLAAGGGEEDETQSFATVSNLQQGHPRSREAATTHENAYGRETIYVHYLWSAIHKVCKEEFWFDIAI